MISRVLLVIIATTVAGCSAAPAATPIIIYVTPAPSIAPVASTPAVIASTPEPTAEPTATPTPGPHWILGHVTLYVHQPTWKVADESCSGSGAYADIRAGLQMTLRDQDNRILGVSPLGEGWVMTPLEACRFLFGYDPAPYAEFYQVESNGRQGLTYSYADMVDNYWTVALELPATHE